MSKVGIVTRQGLGWCCALVLLLVGAGGGWADDATGTGGLSR
ncbi:MAG: hypothetical protein U0231_04630 [Nitrospiraceae bacterium]